MGVRQFRIRDTTLSEPIGYLGPVGTRITLPAPGVPWDATYPFVVWALIALFLSLGRSETVKFACLEDGEWMGVQTVIEMLSHFGFEKPNSEPKIASYPTDLDLGII